MTFNAGRGRGIAKLAFRVLGRLARGRENDRAANSIRVAHAHARARVAHALAPALLVLASTGCTQFENAMASIPVFSFLRDAPFFDPYESPRPAPPNSVPFSSPAGDVPGPIFSGPLVTDVALTAFGATVQNPLAANDTAALSRGKVMYDRHCMVCHGPQASGGGPIVGPGKFPPLVPNLMLPQTVNRSDGYLYGVIAAGRGLMPAYGPRMNHLERWATVNYLRQLQRGGAPAAPTAAPVQPAAR
ncbi:MAG: c-type cytochrome [Gemmatimonadota bacterium]